MCGRLNIVIGARSARSVVATFQVGFGTSSAGRIVSVLLNRLAVNLSAAASRSGLFDVTHALEARVWI